MISFAFFSDCSRSMGMVSVFIYCASAKNKLLRIVFYQVECGLFVMQMEVFVYNC
ncbi:hypothetical protein Xedl_01872 [Xenorhabdus eapokensis]|uniref:Biopterin-dependent aromatic amino acid hydroxylase family profile domain-containing protein n=1 Tax=Xenorhabdus eapokensis TaxID=1873482 RepID=A0A1Q5TST3_9GAMM|nr:hypothetical protein Xedl_01872 [Xenorhabdus eapokensis]